MDILELIKRAYGAVGLGAQHDLLDLFEQRLARRPRWVVRDLVDTGHDYAARDPVAMDLFGGLPPQYEVIGAQPERWRLDGRRRRLVVTGRFRARPRGTWDVFSLPFAHIWYLGDGRIERVVSYLDGVELRRAAA